MSSDDFSVFGTDDTFTVDEIEIQQLEGAEGEVEEVEPSYSPTVRPCLLACMIVCLPALRFSAKTHGL